MDSPAAPSWPEIFRLLTLPARFATFAVASVSLKTVITFTPTVTPPTAADTRLDSAALVASLRTLTFVKPSRVVVPLVAPLTPTVVFRVGFTFTTLTPMPTAPVPALRPNR